MIHTVVLAALVLASAAANDTRHAFYRHMWEVAGTRRSGDSRRVFGGEAVGLSTFPGTCVLLDRYWAPRCSAAVVAQNWAVTAAHCVSPNVAYVKYNTRRPSSPDGLVAAVVYMYAHPGYKVVERDEGRGIDVTELHHDVGLVRTRSSMSLRTTPAARALQPVDAMQLYDLEAIPNEKVQVLGFGRTERSSLGEELFEAHLKVVQCERSSWEHCVCGVGDAMSGPGARGVCAGDSGGPVVFRGAQVGVTSMGPLECAAGPADPSQGATSVFTSLHTYVPLLNATIHNTESALQMRRISSSGSLPSSPRGAPLLLTTAVLSTYLLILTFSSDVYIYILEL